MSYFFLKIMFLGLYWKDDSVEADWKGGGERCMTCPRLESNPGRCGYMTRVVTIRLPRFLPVKREFISCHCCSTMHAHGGYLVGYSLDLLYRKSVSR